MRKIKILISFGIFFCMNIVFGAGGFCNEDAYVNNIDVKQNGSIYIEMVDPKKAGTFTTTSAVRGIFRKNASTRNEFFSLIKK